MKPTRRRIGILGGSFDPIHCGHLDAGSAVASALELTELIVMPARLSPHRVQPFASSFHRFAMVALAVSGRLGWRVSDMEMQHEGPSYTATTLGRFHELGYDAAELFFITGADAFTEIASWKDYPGILEQAHFAVVSRPGKPVEELATHLPALAKRMVQPSGNASRPVIFLIDARTSDVSSTAIRQRLADGRSIAGLVDPRVQQHIERHGLYTSNNPERRDGDEQPNPAAGRLHGQG